MIAQRHDGTTKITTLRRDDVDFRFPGLLDAVLSAAPQPGSAGRLAHHAEAGGAGRALRPVRHRRGAELVAARAQLVVPHASAATTGSRA